MANLNPTENPPIPYITGDPDDHEIGHLLQWPGKLGCLIWGVSASTILCVGSGLVGVSEPESFNIATDGKVAVVVATALLAWPAASFFWVAHLDSKHYDHYVDHFHLETALPKAAWNTVAWAGNSLIQAGKNLRKPK